MDEYLSKEKGKAKISSKPAQTGAGGGARMQIKVGGRGLDANKLIGARSPASSHSDFLSSARVPVAGTSTPEQPLPRTLSPPVNQDVLPRQEEHSPDNGESVPRPRCVCAPCSRREWLDLHALQTTLPALSVSPTPAPVPSPAPAFSALSFPRRQQWRELSRPRGTRCAVSAQARGPASSPDSGDPLGEAGCTSGLLAGA